MTRRQMTAEEIAHAEACARAREAQKEAERRGAKRRGYATIEEWREAQAINNKKKTYEVKVEHLRRELAKVEAWLAEHENFKTW